MREAEASGQPFVGGPEPRPDLEESIRAGRIGSLLNVADLGLFERPYTDASLADRIVLRDGFRALALAVAQQSMVLLKNGDDLLPLVPGAQRIALIGPLADN